MACVLSFTGTDAKCAACNSSTAPPPNTPRSLALSSPPPNRATFFDSAHETLPLPSHPRPIAAGLRYVMVCVHMAISQLALPANPPSLAHATQRYAQLENHRRSRTELGSLFPYPYPPPPTQSTNETPAAKTSINYIAVLFALILPLPSPATRRHVTQLESSHQGKKLSHMLKSSSLTT